MSFDDILGIPIDLDDEELEIKRSEEEGNAEVDNVWKDPSMWEIDASGDIWKGDDIWKSEGSF